MGLFLYIIGILLGVWTGFCVGVLYASGMLPFRLRPLSRLSCFLGAHDWRGSKVMGWAECVSCGELKDLGDCIEAITSQIEPMFPLIIPVRRRDFFESAEWIYELKHGWVSGACPSERGPLPLHFAPRKGMKRFTDLATCIAKELKVTDGVLDGEIVAVDGNGRPAFYDLMKRQCRPVYYGFDILWLNGRDLRSCRLVAKEESPLVIPRKSSWVGVGAMGMEARGSFLNSSSEFFQRQ